MERARWRGRLKDKETKSDRGTKSGRESERYLERTLGIARKMKEKEP